MKPPWCPRCSELEGKLLRARTRHEAFYLRVRQVAEKMASDASTGVAVPVLDYRDLLVTALEDAWKSTPDTDKRS